MFSDYDRLMATLDSVKFASDIIGQFGYDLATFWVTYTGVDSPMVYMYLGGLLKITLGPHGLVILRLKVNKLFMSTNCEKLACFGCR